MSLAKVTRSKKPSRCSARRWNCTWKTSPSPITWGTRSSLRSTSPWRPRDRARPAAVEQGDDQDPGPRGILGHPHPWKPLQAPPPGPDRHRPVRPRPAQTRDAGRHPPASRYHGRPAARLPLDRRTFSSSTMLRNSWPRSVTKSALVYRDPWNVSWDEHQQTWCAVCAVRAYSRDVRAASALGAAQRFPFDPWVPGSSPGRLTIALTCTFAAADGSLCEPSRLGFTVVGCPGLGSARTRPECGHLKWPRLGRWSARILNLTAAAGWTVLRSGPAGRPAAPRPARPGPARSR